MTETARRDRIPPPGVRSMTTFIERHGFGHFQRVAELGSTQPDGTTLTERTLVAEFHHRVEELVIDYEQEDIPPRGDELIFRHIYEDDDKHGETAEPLNESDRPKPSATADRYAAITKLLALETEFRGPRRLSGTQNTFLAEWYEKLGRTLRSVDLPAHAALAYKRATWLHGIAEDFSAQDRCRLARARAKRRATKPAWKRLPGFASDVLCGYGFHPFLLLFWIGVQLALFTGVLLIVEHQSLSTSVQLCVTNYLDPVGIGDLDSKDIGAAGRFVLGVEAWTGIVFTSVFFALLVRRWFRF